MNPGSARLHQPQGRECSPAHERRWARRATAWFLALTVLSAQTRAERFEIDPARSTGSARVTLGSSTGLTFLGVSGFIDAEHSATNQTLRIDGVSVTPNTGGSGMFVVAVTVPPFGDATVNFSSISHTLVSPVPGEELPLSPTGHCPDAWCRVRTQGTLSYNAEGLVCGRLSSEGVACNVSTNVSLLGPPLVPFEQIRFSSQGSMRELSGQFEVWYLANPPLGPTGGLVVHTVRFVATSSACRADFDGSGTVDVADLFDFLDAWFVTQGQTGPGLATDFDTDQTVTVDDLFGFLDAWFMGC